MSTISTVKLVIYPCTNQPPNTVKAQIWYRISTRANCHISFYPIYKADAAQEVNKTNIS